MTMRKYLEARAKVFTTCPDELKINDVLDLYRQIDELRAENKLLADTAAKLAKELTQADKLAKALKDLFENCQMVHTHWGENSNAKQADDAIATARAALDDYKS